MKKKTIFLVLLSFLLWNCGDKSSYVWVDEFAIDNYDEDEILDESSDDKENVHDDEKKDEADSDNESEKKSSSSKSGLDDFGSTYDKAKQKLTDNRDHKVYRTVLIGHQVWMAENLAYKGDSSFCYAKNEKNCELYGRLYQWASALDMLESKCGVGKSCAKKESYQGICPEDWHLPSKADWDTLIAFVGGKDIAGKVLKAKSGWEKASGIDSCGFSVLPAGERSSAGESKNKGYEASFWTSTEKDAERAIFIDFEDAENVSVKSRNKDFASSVRCVYDELQNVSSSSKKVSSSSEKASSSSVASSSSKEVSSSSEKSSSSSVKASSSSVASSSSKEVSSSSEKSSSSSVKASSSSVASSSSEEVSSSSEESSSSSVEVSSSSVASSSSEEVSSSSEETSSSSEDDPYGSEESSSSEDISYGSDESSSSEEESSSSSEETSSSTEDLSSASEESSSSFEESSSSQITTADS